MSGEILKSISDACDRTFDLNRMENCEFNGTHYECKFRFADLLGANLRDGYFDKCVFYFCDMNKLQAQNAVFMNCQFIGCYMRNAQFIEGCFMHCTFESCTAYKADFSQTYFQDSVLSGNFMQTEWKESIHIDVTLGKILLQRAFAFPDSKKAAEKKVTEEEIGEAEERHYRPYWD